jgi:hypothetical protein
MAMVNSAAALWCVDLISRRFVRGDMRIIVLLLLMLLLTYQFHASASTQIRYSSRSGHFRRIASCDLSRAADLFGPRQLAATAAIAMLGKYYSIFLIASFVFAAICHPQRRAYFSSFAPLVSAVAGLAVLGPHF